MVLVLNLYKTKGDFLLLNLPLIFSPIVLRNVSQSIRSAQNFFFFGCVWREALKLRIVACYCYHTAAFSGRPGRTMLMLMEAKIFVCCTVGGWQPARSEKDVADDSPLGKIRRRLKERTSFWLPLLHRLLSQSFVLYFLAYCTHIPVASTPPPPCQPVMQCEHGDGESSLEETEFLIIISVCQQQYPSSPSLLLMPPRFCFPYCQLHIIIRPPTSNINI